MIVAAGCPQKRHHVAFAGDLLEAECPRIEGDRGIEVAHI
jgi:hypothetical protein